MHNVADATHRRARSGGWARVSQCDTYRYSGHHVGDINREYYRSKQEEHLWKTDRDPILVLARWLIDERLCGLCRSRPDHIGSSFIMEDAVKFAIAAPYPNVDEVGQDVYA